MNLWNIRTGYTNGRTNIFKRSIIHVWICIILSMVGELMIYDIVVYILIIGLFLMYISNGTPKL